MAQPVEVQRGNVPPQFIVKTYQLLEDPSADDLISWSEDGCSLVVWQTAEFARVLLPKYFKHNNFSSFVRQLNTYGFRKVAGERCEFMHEFFKRGERKLLKGIIRRNGKTLAPVNQVIQRQSPTSSNSTTTAVSSHSSSELGEENDRLRMENARLTKELKQLKTMWNYVYSMVSNYASLSLDNDDRTIPKLFGMSIGVKQ